MISQVAEGRPVAKCSQGFESVPDRKKIQLLVTVGLLGTSVHVNTKYAGTELFAEATKSFRTDILTSSDNTLQF